jgi:hypothetical protein
MRPPGSSSRLLGGRRRQSHRPLKGLANLAPRGIDGTLLDGNILADIPRLVGQEGARAGGARRGNVFMSI